MTVFKDLEVWLLILPILSTYWLLFDNDSFIRNELFRNLRYWIDMMMGWYRYLCCYPCFFLWLTFFDKWEINWKKQDAKYYYTLFFEISYILIDLIVSKILFWKLKLYYGLESSIFNKNWKKIVFWIKIIEKSIFN